MKIGHGPAMVVYDLTYIMSKFISSNRLNLGWLRRKSLLQIDEQIRYHYSRICRYYDISIKLHKLVALR
jgi:hypothetical protein